MKENWTYKKLEEVATYVNGYAFKPSDWVKNGLPIIRIQNLNNEDAEYNYYAQTLPAKYIVENGDILISWSASLGVYEWHRGKALLNQHIFKVVFDKSDINNHYLKYCVSAKLDQMANLAHGATMRHIVKGDFDNTKIPVPPLSEQQSIVRELDLLNDLIAKKRAQVAEYDQLQQSLFYTMFGDPVTNEKGWEVKKLGEVAIATTGITYSPDDVSDKGTVVLRSSNIQENLLDFSDVVRVNKEIKDKYIAKEGDILMCSRNGSFRLVGKTAKITGLQETMTWGAFMTIIRSDYNPYLLQYFRSPAFREQLTTAKTTTVNQITIGMLNAVSLPLPPLPLQQEFARKVEAIEALKAKVNDSIRETETLLASRMDYYFG